jgi:hypothetical protein
METSSIVTLATIYRCFHGYRIVVFKLLQIYSVVWNSLEYSRVCVWIRTPFGLKTKFVSGNCEKST